MAVLLPSATPLAGKLGALFRHADETGWAVVLRSDENVTYAKVTRSDEIIEIEWEDVHFISATYTLGGRTTSLRNVSAAKHAMRVPEAEVAARVPRRAVQRAAARAAHGLPVAKPVPAPKPTQLPFDPASATEAEVLAAVAGKKIAWVNSFTGAVESALFSPGTKNAKVTTTTVGRRILSWPGDSQGYHQAAIRANSGRKDTRSYGSSEGWRAVALDAIVAVK
jgi:hypothetical protein